MDPIARHRSLDRQGPGRPRVARPPRLSALISIVALLGSLIPATVTAVAPAAVLANTPNPTSVTIVGDLQSELGCPADWQPGCAATHLIYDGADDVWQRVFTPPSGAYEYKAALNDSWDENYGRNAVPGGANITLAAAGGNVKFYYDHKTHWVTDNVGSTIAVAPGSFQSELGCPDDWQPDCLRSWLEDPDGDGTDTFETTAIPAGSYEAKVALNESWDVNYGAGGVQNGANIAFIVPVNGSTTTFSYDSSSHILSITSVAPPGHHHDNNVEWDGLRHDSRDALYRTPGGAVPAGTPVTLRFRTFHDDVTSVKARFYSINLGGQQIVPMSIAASDVSCYQAGLADQTCDFWQLTLPADQPATGADNLWYRFIVTDGTKTAYYADDTPALDGGLGTPSDNPIDNSWALMRYEPTFSAPAWASKAVIYQIFPDRFRNGRKNNDPATGDVRYSDPVLALPWGTKPEGYCRNYAVPDAECPWRFDPTQTGREQPRGRDYFGGDLKGVDQELDYLVSLGVNTLYFNPIFDAGSNHSYDTQDYKTIDPYFGTQKDWDNLVKHARNLGVRIILDGVFNHMSSDSPFFDRYHHYSTVGACESASSAYRTWFTFHDVAPGTGTCRSSSGVADAATYDGWFGFDSIPVLTKSQAAVQQYFLTAGDSVAKHWLAAGASGWRLDVAGDPSFPDGYWQTFRTVVKTANPNALTISETWQKDSTLLRAVRGDRFDTTMNYRLRDAVIAFLAPGPFDSKGFPDSGHVISSSAFLSRLASIREDYPDPVYYSAMNLLDSHDTERLLWTLTPGAATPADKELNAANLAEGKARMQLASLIQFTLPGAPTIYYGDEVGVTGADDPDDRRTYPWADQGGSPDHALFANYRRLATLRRVIPALTKGDFRVLLADDANGVAAYGRKTDTNAAIVVANRGSSAQTVHIPLAGYIHDGIRFVQRYPSDGGAVVVAGGELIVTVPPLSGLLLGGGDVDLRAPAAPTGLHVTSVGNGTLAVAWNAVHIARGYNVYVSPVSGGGFIKQTGSPVSGTSFTITGLANAKEAFVVVTSIDGRGNESGWSNEASGIPHLTIGWANLQWPPAMTHTISAVTPTDTVYGQVWIDGVTNLPGPTPTLRAQLGFGPDGSNPDSNPAWTWVEATFNVDAGNNDEFKATLLPDTIGRFDYAYRYTTTDGATWLYADLDGTGNGYSPGQAGDLHVVASADTTAPGVPTGLNVASASPSAVDLAWDAVGGDPTLYGYEIARSQTPGGPYSVIGLTTATAFTDADVVQGSTYYYVVRAVDESFNRSAYSGEVSATAQLRTVTLTFNVTVPATTDATGRSVHIAGFLDRLDGGYPQWDPGATPLARVDSTHWTITFTGKEFTQLEYKFTLGDWDHVEKDASCGEINNRQLTLSYGTTGTQTVNDTVPNWRAIAPCTN